MIDIKYESLQHFSAVGSFQQITAAPCKVHLHSGDDSSLLQIKSINGRALRLKDLRRSRKLFFQSPVID